MDVVEGEAPYFFRPADGASEHFRLLVKCCRLLRRRWLNR